MASIMFTSGRKSPIFGNIPHTPESDAPVRGSQPRGHGSGVGGAENGVGADGYARATLYRARRRRFVALSVSLRKTKAPAIFR